MLLQQPNCCINVISVGGKTSFRLVVLIGHGKSGFGLVEKQGEVKQVSQEEEWSYGLLETSMVPFKCCTKHFTRASPDQCLGWFVE